jgi:hypothetical protein
MRLQGPDNLVRFGATVLAAALVGVLGAASLRASVGRAAAPAGPERTSATPAASPSPSPAPAPTPDAPPSPVPAASPEPAGTPQAAPGAPAAGTELPRIVRTVCTDRVCGGCDGKCRASSGHVAVDKKGHCACTPADGGALDRAIRQAYQRNPPQ